MTPEELRTALEEGVAKASSPTALVFTFVGRSSRGLGIRPIVLSEMQSGEKVYGVDCATAKRWLKKL